MKFASFLRRAKPLFKPGLAVLSAGTVFLVGRRAFAQDKAPSTPAGPPPKGPVPSKPDASDPIVAAGLLAAWQGNALDPIYWRTITIPTASGTYKIEVGADALSAHGMRIPSSFDEQLKIMKDGGFAPMTKVIADAIWSAADRKVHVLDASGKGDVASFPKGPDGSVRQVLEWNAKIGPISNGSKLVDGPWKHWIVEPTMPQAGPGSSVNYGFRTLTGLWQTPGHRHDKKHGAMAPKGGGDYSQLMVPVRRAATLDGAPVDLVEVLRAGGPLGGPLPKWIAEELGA